ncbi:MAG: response regulator [Chitinophagaceae bacterium]|nr:MAG: response regulator [Chitinophagaceae bacterium]
MSVQKQQAKKVLLVEDEADMCLLLNIMLTGDEMEVDHVKTISAAKDYLDAETPAVVLLDNRLPDGLGIDFISSIKKSHPSTRVIMISGSDGSAKDIALENGADEFLTKPFTKVHLYESVMKQLQ